MYRKITLFPVLLGAATIFLAGCTPTYQAPIGNPNVAKFTYSNSDEIYVKNNPIDCSDNQELPTQKAGFFSMFTGGVDPYSSTEIVSGRLVTLGFAGENLPMPELSTDNQLASRALSLLTHGKHDSSVTAAQFQDAAGANCSFALTFIPQRGATYRYDFEAKNVGHDLGGATFQCSLQLQRLKSNQWMPVPVLPRDSNVGGFMVNGVPDKCSTEGFLSQLQSGNISKLPLVTKISKKFTVSSETSTKGMLTGS